MRGNQLVETQDARIAVLEDVVRRLLSVLAECYDLAGWHADDDCDPNETSPEDMAAHVNGLIRRKIAAIEKEMK